MTNIQEGDKAPDFQGLDQDGKQIRLKDFRGKKLVLYFYPKDDTPGCTAEACDFRDNYKALQKAGYAVLGVSHQGEASHKKFVTKYDLPFPLLADTEKEVLHAYGVWGMKKFMGREYMGTMRTTFIIDEKGVIERIISKVKTKAATEQVLS